MRKKPAGDVIRAAGAIEKAVNENFDGRRMKLDFVPALVREYGAETLANVFAGHILRNDTRGAFSPKNAAWAERWIESERIDPENMPDLEVVDIIVDSLTTVVKRDFIQGDGKHKKRGSKR